LLSFLHRARLDAIVTKARPTKRTPHTLTTLAEIRREADLTLKRGYSIDDEEFNLGVRCLAAPVFSSDGSVVAAIGITAATVRFTRERIPEIAAIVTQSAAELSRLLGYHGPRS
jgi:IclR family acetate operon transcriptional repressor